MLMAYWMADQLGNPELPPVRRRAFAATLSGVAPALRGAAEELLPFAVAASVRRNGVLLAEARSYERARVAAGAVLDALLLGHEDDAVQNCLRDIGAHSGDVAGFLAELERRGRKELRNALEEQGDGTAVEALGRLLRVVLFAAGRR
jgi:hypothetical protein